MCVLWHQTQGYPLLPHQDWDPDPPHHKNPESHGGCLLTQSECCELSAALLQSPKCVSNLCQGVPVTQGSILSSARMHVQLQCGVLIAPNSNANELKPL